MAKFEKMRSDALMEKNKAVFKSMELEEKAEAIEKKKAEVEEGISRIPKDLPEELQAEIDRAIAKTRTDIKSEAREISDASKEAQDDADKSFDKMMEDGRDLQRKGDKLSELNSVPLLGAFAEAKGKEMLDHGEQMLDIAKETQEHSDKLAETRRKMQSI